MSLEESLRLATRSKLDITSTILRSMLDESKLSQLLLPFGLELSANQTSQLLTYLDLLMRWNRKINLTAIRSEEECVRRHFGESLYVSRWLHLEGRVLDVGTGAGFPGLALKIVFPSLAVTLLEPVSKKRAYLKEVARVCAMDSVEVRGERLEDFVEVASPASFETVTSRAVGQLDSLVPDASRCIVAGGRLCLWLTHAQALALPKISPRFSWAKPIPIPLGRESEILVGTLVH